MKTIYIFFTFILLVKVTSAQIYNGSFETTILGASVAGPNSGSTDVWNWNIIVHGTSDYFSPACISQNFNVPDNIAGHLQAYSGNSYMGIATIQDNNSYIGEYAATSVELIEGATYEFSMHVSLASHCKYKNKLGINIVENIFLPAMNPFPFISGGTSIFHQWGDDADGMVSTQNGEWTELKFSFVAAASGSYYLMIGYFRDETNPEFNLNDNQANLIPGGPMSILAYYLLDGLSLTITQPPPPPPPPLLACCPYNACYTNTFSLPDLTLVTNFIKAGNAAGCSGANAGLVTVSSGQNVVFNAGSFIEIGNQEVSPGVYTNIAGMDIQQGAVFDAIIEGCSSSNSSTLPPINVSVANYVYRHTWYIAEVENATEYEIKVYNRWGTDLVYQASGSVFANYTPLWYCNLVDGTYYVFLTFKNCNETKSLSPFFITVFDDSDARHSGNNNINDTLPIISMGKQPDGGLELNEPSKIAEMVFPNPLNDEFYISSKNKIKRIRLVDASGKLIMDSFHDHVTYLKVGMEGFEKGFYLLEIEDIDSKKYYHKLIKN